jgi:hypothetical protein
MVETAFALLRLALERGWTIGLLFLLFCGAALTAPHYAVELPDPVKQWSAAGFIFGGAVLLVSLAANVEAIVSRRLHARAGLRAKRAKETIEAQDAIANLEVLNAGDAAVLERLLSSGGTRFEIGVLGDEYRLVKLGLLIKVRTTGQSSWICEPHPAIMSRRSELAEHLRDQLKRLS